MPNKIFVAIGTPIVFQGSGGDVVITLLNLAAGAGRVSARHDFGLTRSRLFEWRAVIRNNTGGTIGETVDFYLATSDGTLADGTISTADGPLGSTNQLRNMHPIGSVVCDTTGANTDIISSGFIRINSRYASLVVHNNQSVILQNTANVNKFILTPVPDEVQ